MNLLVRLRNNILGRSKLKNTWQSRTTSMLPVRNNFIKTRLTVKCFASVIIVWTQNKDFTISDRWPLYLFYFDSKNLSGVGDLCVLRATTKKRSSTFWRKKVHPGDLARGCSDLEMTWPLCRVGAASAPVSTGMGDRVRVQFRMRQSYLDM